jgi:hypothetical protein
VVRKALITVSLCMISGCDAQVSTPPPLSDAEIERMIANADAGNKAVHWELFSYFDVQDERDRADVWYKRCLKVGESTCSRDHALTLKMKAERLQPSDPRRKKLLMESRNWSAVADKRGGQ